MDFAIPEDILEFKNIVKAFAKKEVLPSAEERDLNGVWDHSIWMKMGEMGLLGLPIPQEYGGQGGSCLLNCLATEGFAEGGMDGGLTLAWGAHSIIGCMPIVLCGTDAQKKKYLPRLASGEWTAALGLTEPSSGSDAAGSMETRAVKKGDKYIINGSKMFITNGPIGDVFIVMAVTDKAKGAMGVSVFIVEKTFKGFKTGKKLHKLGMRTSTTSNSFLKIWKFRKKTFSLRKIQDSCAWAVPLSNGKELCLYPLHSVPCRECSMQECVMQRKDISSVSPSSAFRQFSPRLQNAG